MGRLLTFEDYRANIDYLGLGALVRDDALFLARR
jgi:hypothetical protein